VNDACKGCAHLSRCEADKRTRVMFRVLHPEIQTTLRNLSADGVIYIGREGIGLTHLFRRELLRLGTIKAINQHCSNAAPEEIRLIELAAIEGPRWLCYQRVIDALWSVQKHAKTVKPTLPESEAACQEIWGGAGETHL